MSRFPYTGQQLDVTPGMKAAFDTDGYVVVSQLLSGQELSILEEALTGPDSLSSPRYSFKREDGDGHGAMMTVWNNPGDDSTGTVARMRKVSETAEQLLGGEVYHYHTKFIMKNAGTGGRFVWHQDYGYWYNFGCLFPDMLTVFIALDKCETENGCLQVLRGSHKCGRIDTKTTVGGQNGADVTRLTELSRLLDQESVQLEPGDALFFHSNLLHTSAQNPSARRRWAMLACYNRRHNSPCLTDKNKVKHAWYQPLVKLDNDALTRQGVDRNFAGKEIIRPERGDGQSRVQEKVVILVN